MTIKNSTNKYLMLDISRKYIMILLLVMGVFLFPKTAFLSTISPEKIIELTNIERVENNLTPLRASQYLAQAAHNKAIDIFANQKFDHSLNNKKFSAWIKEVGYEYNYVGENLAIDFVTAEGVLSAWEASPSHYKNIINENFEEIGVAVLSDIFENNNSILVVQIFGTPKNDLIDLNLDNEIITKEANIKNNSLSSISYLTHSNENELKLFSDSEIFLENAFEKITLNEEDKNKSSIPDLFFTLVGFMYLGVFKLVSLKNIGL